MKKVLKTLSVMLVLIALLAVSACGEKGADITGKYFVAEILMQGEPLDLDGEYVEINSGGKGNVYIGLEWGMKWKLEGDAISVTMDAPMTDVYSGTLKDGVMVLDMGGTMFTFVKEGATAPPSGVSTSENAAAPAESETPEPPEITGILGYYDCTGAEFSGMKMGASGEWMEIEAGGRGAVQIAGNEYPFDWTLDGETLTIKEDVGVTYTATYADGIIVLNTGMLYTFERAANSADVPRGELTIPSKWYGAMWSDEFPDGIDIFAEFGNNGKPFFEAWDSVDAFYDRVDAEPVMSMYIESDYSYSIIPEIAGGDAWFMDHFLEGDDIYEYLGIVQDGILFFSFEYLDGSGNSYTVDIYMRESGSKWNEDHDLMPPGYETYKNGF